MELSIAQSIADNVLKSISPFCHRSEIAGSIRRKKSEVKDIEIVARVNDWEGLFVSLQSHGIFIKSGVPDVQPWPPKKGAKYLRMMLHGEIKLDLFIADEHNWGALFMMRTGGATGPTGNPFEGFTPMMFARWKRVSGGGRMMNCLPTLPDGRTVSVPEEEDFFKLCGCDWTPPEERISSSAIRKQRGYKLQIENFSFVNEKVTQQLALQLVAV